MAWLEGDGVSRWRRRRVANPRCRCQLPRSPSPWSLRAGLHLCAPASKCPPVGPGSHRPTGFNLLARWVLRNRRHAGAWVLGTIVDNGSERVVELAAAGDLKLAIHAVQMRLGGRGRDEQRLGDLPTGEALGGEPRDAQLGGGQRVTAGDRVAPRLGACGDQLRARLVGDPPGAETVGEIQRALKLGPGLKPAAGTA
jgi:hypothetical protein